MTSFKKLIGEKLYLSPCKIEDAALWTEWFNDLEVSIPLGDEAYDMVTLGNQAQLANQFINEGSRVFSIVDKNTDETIGRCLLFNIHHIDRRAMMGIVIGEKSYWNQGYGTEATSLLLDYAFNLLNLNRVELGVFSFNQRAIRSYQKVGFQMIGTRRQFRILAGETHDLILMDILADEFESPFVKPLFERIRQKNKFQ